MTIDERALGLAPSDVRVVQHDRRRANPPDRISWASPMPFRLDGRPMRTAEEVAQLAEARRRAWTQPLMRRVMGTDFIVAALVMAACLGSLRGTRDLAPVGSLLAATLWVLVIGLLGGYDRRRVGDGPEEFGSILQAAVVVVALAGVVAFSFQLTPPRRDVLVAVPLAAVLTAVGRYGWRRWLHRRRRRGVAMLRTLVVGEPFAIGQIAQDITAGTHHGIQLVGACVPAPGEAIRDLTGVDLLGSISEVPQVVVDHQIDNVLVVGSQLTGEPLRRLSWALERTGADLMVAPGLVEVTGSYVSLHPVAGLSLLRVERPAQRSGRLVAKTALDRSLGMFLFCMALPIIGLAALAVRMTSPGAAFFAQQRVGRDGELFTMWKLRSMVTDAEDLVIDLRDSSDRDGLMFKMHADPRVTRVGAVLRRYSIDELPQLFNVVKGDMSLVGPRPPLPREYEQYTDSVHRRLRVKPGLTGLWQVSGRADLPWQESVRLDLRYVDNWSAAMDLQILWKTIRAVLTGSGAY